MTTQIKIEARFSEIQGMVRTLFSTPVNKLTRRQLSILPTALTFSDCYLFEEHGVERDIRDLKSTQSAQSFDHLCDMLCLVKSYNSYDPKSVCEVLEKHKDFINFEATLFGREYSPVLYLSLKRDIFSEDESLFMEKAKALADDLKKVALCDELQWCARGTTPSGDFTSDVKPTMWVPVYVVDEIIGYEERTFDSFRRFRVCWD